MEYSVMAKQQAEFLRRQADQLMRLAKRLRTEKQKLNCAWISEEMRDINANVELQLRRINRAVREIDALYVDMMQAAAELDAEQG